MDSWTTLVLFFFISLLCLLLASQLNGSKRERKLPPGPPSIRILGSLVFLTKGMAGLAEACHELQARYGSIFTLYAGSRPIVFITDGELARKLLIEEHPVAFADRLPANKTERLYTANQYSINSAPYGPLWRILRRNFASEVLHASRIKMHSGGREWAIRQLLNDLHTQAAASVDGEVKPLSSFKFAFFGLFTFICFGEQLDETILREIQQNIWEMHSLVNKELHPFKFFSKVLDFLQRRRWDKILELYQKITDHFQPLIQARRDRIISSGAEKHYAYVDSLLDLRLPHDGDRKLTQPELVALCSELYVAGIETTTVVLQWTMARLVKHANIQKRLVKDIKGVVGATEWVTEEDVQKLPFLKALIKESLRLHPPGNFVVPHRVSEDVRVDDYVISKGTTVSVAVGVINRDGKLWEDAMEFKPERFMPRGEVERLNQVKGTEIMMMPFGVGMRRCPASVLATLLLEYFVANLIWKFEWKAVEGEEVDMTEETAFTVHMKNPLKARLLPRRM